MMTIQEAAKDCVSAEDLANAGLWGKAERGEIAPTCETCPLSTDGGTTSFGGVHKKYYACNHSLSRGELEWNADHYCEHHPLYPAWAMGECLRRVQKLGGAK